MKIIFVCTGNSCRSPMAEGYFAMRIKDAGMQGIEVDSAGIAAPVGMPSTQEAVDIISQAGGDIAGHKARQLSAEDVAAFDYIFVMEEAHRRYIVRSFPEASSKTYLLKDFKTFDEFDYSQSPEIADPIGRDAEFYRGVFLVIRDSVERILKAILQQKEEG